MLGALIAQGEAGGIDRITLEALVEEASARGAHQAMSRLGLEDRSARRDMDDLRELLAAWRSAKRSALKALVGWVVRLGLAILCAAIAFQAGLLAMDMAA